MLAFRANPEESLRARIRTAYHCPSTSELELQQIYASIPDGADALFKVFEEETDPINFHVDFHFTGVGIDRNSIAARALVAIISGISDATAEVIKQDFSRFGKADPVSVVGLSSGSFVVSLEAAPVEGLPSPFPSHECEALERVVTTLFSDGSESLPSKALSKLRKTTNALDKNKIQFEATTRRRYAPRQVFRYDENSFRSLVAKLNQKEEQSNTQTFIGRFDGFSLSDQTMTLLVDKSKHRIKVSSKDLSEIISLFGETGVELWLECQVAETVVLAGRKHTSQTLVSYSELTPESS